MSTRENGVSFWDAREAAHALGALYHCIVHFEMHLPMRRNERVCWHVRCVARWYDEKGRITKERGEGAEWPNVDAKTFAGLEFLLVTRLERKIEDEERDTAMRVYSQGGMF